MKHTVMGILAHVDAGKTTLSESMLYLSGAIRKSGRVDHGDAFLDYDTQEKSRGITIFSKQAGFEWKDTSFVFVDTPGHSDFSSEMERTLQILDYAVLVISALDGVQMHTETIWKLLSHYHIPVFIFVNKMDVDYVKKDKLFDELKVKFSENCIDFSDVDKEEAIAMVCDELLEEYSENACLSKDSIQKAILQRNIFPCIFGSALKMDGVESLLDTLNDFIIEKRYPESFGAKIFKITRDSSGNRLTHMKITGGSLKVKTKFSEQDKVDEIRIYQGSKYTLKDIVNAGTICVVKGLSSYQAFDVLGNEEQECSPFLSSYMHYQIVLAQGYDQSKALFYLKQLSEEDPQLCVEYDEEAKQIHVQLMGEVQISVLKQQLLERFGLSVELKQGSVVFKETIAESVEGVGHYEPLRHYAEVHLLLEPLPLGSGILLSSICPEDELSLSYQNLILSHLEETTHIGVLVGAPITDMRITLLSGRAHEKHTEGGDFREATYRALRQGLKSTRSVLLEPYYHFQLYIPREFMSRAVFDIEQMNGNYILPDTYEDMLLISGRAPVRKMQHYQSEVQHYTKGKGRLSFMLDGYDVCADQEDMIKEIGYDSERDIKHPTGSIFCSHGAGFYVPYNEVYHHMHIKTSWFKQKQKQERKADEHYAFSEKEVLSMLFPKNQGAKRKQYAAKKQNQKQIIETKTSLPKCVLVDGYNVIFAWESLSLLAEENIDAARMQLIDLMCSYQGYRKCELILVFDAYKVNENVGSMIKHGNIHVVYTKTAQTADMYIEAATHKLAKDFEITVVSGDALIQLITMGQGAYRKSAYEFEKEVIFYQKKGFLEVEENQKRYRTHPLEKIKEYQQ